MSCEICEQKTALVYCVNDRAHFCRGCDVEHHSQDALLQKHRRLGIEHSPYQFGMCDIHPSERYEAVCLDCSTLLCSHCILIGSHAGPDFADHNLVSTLDAFKQAMAAIGNKTNLALSTKSRSSSGEGRHDMLNPDPEAASTREALEKRMETRQEQLQEVHKSFEGMRKRVESVLKRCLHTVTEVQDRKLQYLHARRREMLAQLLLLEWLDAFYEHARITLSPVDFLRSARRHELLVKDFLTLSSTQNQGTGLQTNFAGSRGSTGGSSAKDVVADLPAFISENIVIEGSLDVVMASGPSRIPSTTAASTPAPSANPQVPTAPTVTEEQGHRNVETQNAQQYQYEKSGSVQQQEHRLDADLALFGPVVHATPRGRSGALNEPQFFSPGPASELRAPLSASAALFVPPSTSVGSSATNATTNTRRLQQPEGEGEASASSSTQGTIQIRQYDPQFSQGAAAPALEGTSKKEGGDVRASSDITNAVGTGAAAAVDARIMVSVLQSGSTEWGDTLQLLRELPTRERGAVDHVLIELLNARRDGSLLELLRAALAEDMDLAVRSDSQGRTLPIPVASSVTFLFSTRSVVSALAAALVKTAAVELLPLEPELRLLLRQTEKERGPQQLYHENPGALFSAITDYIQKLHVSARSSEFPPLLLVLLHRLFEAADAHFGQLVDPLAVVGAFVISRILSPLLLRLAQKKQEANPLDVEPLSYNVSEVSRWFQKIARFSLAGDESQAVDSGQQASRSGGIFNSSSSGGTTAESQFLRVNARQMLKVAEVMLRASRRVVGARGEISFDPALYVLSGNPVGSISLEETLLLHLRRSRALCPAASKMLQRIDELTSSATAQKSRGASTRK
ncbi:unnamed protein product [Amoebophrya sp. A25]|nr:unnamed protein product [Amoebophrya sp. A25]|eukprot:GSA25T00011527001.1